MNLAKKYLKINWRVTWYSVMLWIFSIIVGGIVILPWYYVILPIVIFWTTSFYFKGRDKSLRMGLWVSLIWFLTAAILDFLEVIGPYYMDASVYFSDSRNLIKYPLILLTPVIYCLFQENRKIKRSIRFKVLANIEKQVSLPSQI